MDDLFNFYTWHFLDAVPLLDINKSLQWDVPLTYSGALTGWFVIAFQAAVIVPLIQAVRTYIELRGVTPIVRARPWAWPRVARVGRPISLNWAPTRPPKAYVFDVMVARPASDGKTETRWLKGISSTSRKYTAHEPGVFLFKVECRERVSDEVLEKLETAGVRSPIRSWKARVRVKPS